MISSLILPTISGVMSSVWTWALLLCGAAFILGVICPMLLLALVLRISHWTAWWRRVKLWNDNKRTASTAMLSLNTTTSSAGGGAAGGGYYGGGQQYSYGSTPASASPHNTTGIVAGLCICGSSHTASSSYSAAAMLATSTLPSMGNSAPSTSSATTTENGDNSGSTFGRAQQSPRAPRNRMDRVHDNPAAGGSSSSGSGGDGNLHSDNDEGFQDFDDDDLFFAESLEDESIVPGGSGGAPHRLRRHRQHSRTTDGSPTLDYANLAQLRQRNVAATAGVTRAMKTVAFFHPYANDGGGGERVLWAAVKAVFDRQRSFVCRTCGGLVPSNLSGSGSSTTDGSSNYFDTGDERVRVVIFAGLGEDEPMPRDGGRAILLLAKQRFGIDLTSKGESSTAVPGVNARNRDDRFTARTSMRDAAASSIDVLESGQLRFVFLRHRWLVEASTWPHFTLLGQSFGSVLLACEALGRSVIAGCVPDVVLDTMGYAFTYPIFSWLAGMRVGCYTHYPTISTDMLDVVRSGKLAFNNTAAAGSPLRTRAKLLYYRLFAVLYGFVGRRASSVAVNSSWTRGHISAIWRVEPDVVFPPCNTLRYASDIPLACPQARTMGGRDPLILSLGQFRPEKNNELQLRSFARFLRHIRSEGSSASRGDPHSVPSRLAAASRTSPRGFVQPRLILIGSCRNVGDYDRVERLKRLAFEELGLRERLDVEFCINASFADLHTYLRRAMVGIHTMWNEHFGIGVVEFMAAGVVVVAHDSGGPKADIVVPAVIPDDSATGVPLGSNRGVGFLASTEAGYAAAFESVMHKMSAPQRLSMQQRARDHVSTQFSDETFARCFVDALGPLWGWRPLTKRA